MFKMFSTIKVTVFGLILALKDQASAGIGPIRGLRSKSFCLRTAPIFAHINGDQGQGVNPEVQSLAG